MERHHKEELARVLAAAVQRAPRGLPETSLGHVLGAEFDARGLEKGKGAYVPVRDCAVELGLVHRSRVEGRYVLYPPEVVPGKLLGLPVAPEKIDHAVYQAFTGANAPCWLDISAPPEIRVLANAQEGTIEVDVVKMMPIWEEFVSERGVEDVVAQEVREFLRGKSEPDQWGRVIYPTETARHKYARAFHVFRVERLYACMADAFEGANADQRNYRFVSQSGKPTGRSSEEREESRESRGHDPAKELRRRVLAAVSRMPMEHLVELRIPVEYLLD